MIKRVLQASHTALPGELAHRLLQEAAIESGRQPETILARTGIPFTLADLANERSGRIPKPYLIALISQCITTFEEQASLRVSRPPFSIEDLKMLCYCLINCATVGTAIERAAAFCSMLGKRAGRLALTVNGDRAQFTMTTFRSAPSTSAMLSDLVGLTGYHRLFSWLCGDYIEVSEMGTVYESFADRDVLCELFDYSIQFNQRDNYFDFPASYLSRSNVRRYAELEELLRFFPFDLLSDDWLSMNLAKALANTIRACLLSRQSLPSASEVASQFNMSSATLRRRLAEEKTSFSSIKEHCRLSLATELLRHSELSIEEISSHLNFSDSRIFRRAFKQWTGVSPSEYRGAR